MENLIESLTLSVKWASACILTYILSIYITPILLPSFLCLDKRKRFEWYSRNVSALHSLCVAILAYYYWIFINPSLEIPNRLPGFISVELDIMLGYLWYDTCVLLITAAVEKKLSFEFTLHHIMGILSHYSTRLSGNGAAGYYSALVHIAETSTPMLHYGWLFHTLKYSNNIAFKICMLIEVVIFFLCRVVLSSYTFYHVISHEQAWGDSAGGPLYYGNVAIIGAFVLLNYFWFYKMVRVVFLSPVQKSKEVTEGDGKREPDDVVGTSTVSEQQTSELSRRKKTMT